VIRWLFVYLFVYKRTAIIGDYLRNKGEKNNFNIITCLETTLLPRMNYAIHSIHILLSSRENQYQRQ
jgi:hypothetical protein